MSASLGGLGPDRIETVSERLETACRGSVNEVGGLLEACRAYLLLVAKKDLSPNLRAKGGASDLVQETFLAAHQRFRQFRGKTEAELLAWLRSILAGRLSEFSRRYFRTAKRHVARESPPRSHPTRAAEALRVADHSPSPSWAAIEREEAQAVADALERLPPDYVRVILLVHWEHRTFNQAAEEMDRSVEAVRRLWTRAVERLAREFAGKP
jgi:RNA polymerase sigma-70 factor, ECF subfamily